MQNLGQIGLRNCVFGVCVCVCVGGGVCVWGCVCLAYTSEDFHMKTHRYTEDSTPSEDPKTGPRKTLAKNAKNVMFYHLRGLRAPRTSTDFQPYLIYEDIRVLGSISKASGCVCVCVFCVYFRFFFYSWPDLNLRLYHHNARFQFQKYKIFSFSEDTFPSDTPVCMQACN